MHVTFQLRHSTRALIDGMRTQTQLSERVLTRVVCVFVPRVLQRGIGSAEGGVDGGIRLLKYDHFPSHSLSPLVTRGHPTPYLPW